ncbi:hypothetical protein OEZ85_007584 [Tetradesmus obliquus]|uniref:MYND-type domain-containing protein n=1 Tax=Tetradesmus obliquus TaxID=3088 RepID=A0ABY8TGD4_TETOB|nr:hypothetical protein OEZ85_007584 [Tetradesmus obliquus]
MFEVRSLREDLALEFAEAASTTRAAAKAVCSKLVEADAAADTVPWVALVARCLQLYGAAFAAAALTPESAQRHLSESALVGGKRNICSGCKVARYCGKDCQVQHWKQHKAACKRLQAARAR